MKLGKAPRKFNPKTLKLANFFHPEAPAPPPEKAFYEYKIDPTKIGLFMNDELGDCTVAAIAHLLMLVTAHTGTIVTPDPKDVLAFYSAVSGYVPGRPETDNGAAITDVLDRWQTVGLSGHKILGWAEIDHANVTALRQGIFIFGAIDIGVQLPASAENQFNEGKSWEVVPGDPIEGGHCVLSTGYGSEGFNYQSWGRGDQKGSLAWNSAYMDEAYIILTQDWVDNATGLASNTLNMDALRAALAELKA